MSGIMPIINLLIRVFDSLKRDEYGTIQYDEQLKEVTKNLLNHKSLDSKLYSTYDEFFNAVTNGTVIYDRQQRESSDNQAFVIPNLTNTNDEELAAKFRAFGENLYNSPNHITEPERSIFRLLKGCKTKYRYVSDILVKKHINSGNQERKSSYQLVLAEERILLSKKNC